jgi:PPK2 family polyphosphate:nucleotide phosphotransferase
LPGTRWRWSIPVRVVADSVANERGITMDLTKRLRIDPGLPVKLASIDPGFRGKYESEADAANDLREHLAHITKLQRKLYASEDQSLLIVLQGIDAAGKDGTCWHVISAMDPQGVQVQCFKQPTKEELSHDFLWRVHPHAPAKGRISIFNRSHYEDVLVARVHKLVPKEVWKARYDQINDWERLLHAGNNTTILKFFLYISKNEQLARFKERLDDPSHQWKISSSDYTERRYWDNYIEAFEEAMSKCSTQHAPWFVIPSNHKWFRNLAVSQIIANTLDDMDLKPPKPSIDMEEIRRLYEQDAAEQVKGKSPQ